MRRSWLELGRSATGKKEVGGKRDDHTSVDVCVCVTCIWCSYQIAMYIFYLKDFFY